ncbi:hypothetical protein LUZ62_040623 [Rhynchospora pubera]|uniref:Protein root UVB sensitive 5 n=1 Tax=Rhynchospora pubera TaxID=906938 RepID=A0AAV8FGI1_9POAL|nr:hypothetical protein LUZ62_040623 [Rhynchospora pubera]
MIRYTTVHIYGLNPNPNPTSHSQASIRACFSVDNGPNKQVAPTVKLKKNEPALLVERYSDGSSKRYFLNEGLKLQTVQEGDEPQVEKSPSEDTLAAVPSFLKEFVLPAGYPDSVSDDYLEYMLLQFPTNVTGWVCHTLVTSSLLKAVGVGTFAGSAAAASAAAIRWVSKDGIGAIGRLLIGARFGNLFDDDPRGWRMYADLIGSAGSIFELSTPLYPEYFLPLASLGNLAKAVARGLKDPSFRVIQNHFAVSSNLGEIAAKEEVWEVAAQLIGLTFGILIMDTPGVRSSYTNLAFTWLAMRIFHLWFRYKSLSVLKFRTINLKRARILVKCHISVQKVPGYLHCNKEENIFSWGKFTRPYVSFGASIETMVGQDGSGLRVKVLLQLYEKEKYILSVDEINSSKEGLALFVTFKEGADSMTVLRSLWQAHWLDKHRIRLKFQEEESVDLSSMFHQLLEESIVRLQHGFADFLDKLEEAGWDKDMIILKVPNRLIFSEESAHID